MGTRRALALIVLLAAGCGGPTRWERLAPGSSATACGEGDATVPAFFSSRTERLADGTAVRVISDGEGDPTQPRRKVVVSIEGGPSGGLAAQMYRSDLRPEE